MGVHVQKKRTNRKGREKQKIIICVCGMTGCGKSTLAKRLAVKYGIKYVSGGDALKALAIENGYKPGGEDWWETNEGKRFIQLRVNKTEFDRRVDEKLIEMAGQGNVALDSWTMPWLLKNGFKVWLEASLEVRVKRLAERDNISIERALNALKEKEENTRVIYKKLYGFDIGRDFSPFNMILDTNELSADEVFSVICMTIDRIYIKD